MKTPTAALPPHRRRPDLEIDQILAWADAHFQATGDWPTADSGFVRAAGQEKWTNVDAALRKGLRSLTPGSSLARLLALHRGVRNRKELPPLDRDLILEWVDAHHARTGRWPQRHSGPIPEAPGETWMAVEAALGHGLRGLPAGSSLAQILARFRGVRHSGATPLLNEAQVLAWADAHYARTGRWPTAASGPVAEAEGETWSAVNEALKHGSRGLPGGASLANFLEERRGVPNRLHQPDLTVDQILRWADAHHARTGRWPTRSAGPVHNAPGQSWSAVSACLTNGSRGLPGGSSLARLLAEQRGVVSRTGRRGAAPGRRSFAARSPHSDNGPAHTAVDLLQPGDNHPGESETVVTFTTVSQTDPHPDAAREGTDDNPASARQAASSPADSGVDGGRLGALVAVTSVARSMTSTPRHNTLTPPQILEWADAHHARTGRWPTAESAAVEGAPGETWLGVDAALRRGNRGLRRGSSLARLLAEAGRTVPTWERPPLSEELILDWADAHCDRTGRWPGQSSGLIPDAPGERWSAVDSALRVGSRSLPGGSSLARLLRQRRGVRNPHDLPPHSIWQILAWADAHYDRHGDWPTVRSGPIEDAPGETWSGVEAALQAGVRGLPGGTTLHRLLQEHRGK